MPISPCGAATSISMPDPAPSAAASCTSAMRAASICRASPAGGDTTRRRGFEMGPEFDPIAGAQGWQISNPPVLSTAPLLASLEIFQRAGIARLREKSIALTGFLQRLIDERLPGLVDIITPARAGAARLSIELAARAPARRRQALPRALDGGRRDRRLARARCAAAGAGAALQLVQRRLRRRRRSGAGAAPREPAERPSASSAPARPARCSPSCCSAAARTVELYESRARPAQRAADIRPIHQSGAGRSRHSCAAKWPACSRISSRRCCRCAAGSFIDQDGRHVAAALRAAAE